MVSQSFTFKRSFVQMTDLKITIKGAAKVDHEVKERRDGSLLVKYVSHMSGDVSITLVRPCVSCLFGALFYRNYSRHDRLHCQLNMLLKKWLYR